MSRENSALEALEYELGYQFSDRELLRRALTHGSAKTKAERDNQRLEFLGDAILDLIVSADLFADAEHFDEGAMTKIKAQVVAKRSLLQVADELVLEEYLRVGPMFPEPEDIPTSIRADAVESILAAIYLDGGMEEAREFVLDFFGPEMDRACESPGRRDHKSLLGQWAQKLGDTTPVYRVTDSRGPDHQPTFDVVVSLDGKELACASGTSKKMAEQKAARLALEKKSHNQ